jgi:hypothetical protein
VTGQSKTSGSSLTFVNASSLWCSDNALGYRVSAARTVNYHLNSRPGVFDLYENIVDAHSQLTRTAKLHNVHDRTVKWTVLAKLDVIFGTIEQLVFRQLSFVDGAC